jgi:hypothetical protein
MAAARSATRGRAFEPALRRQQQPVDAKPYEGGRRNGLFDDRAQSDDKWRG